MPDYDNLFQICPGYRFDFYKAENIIGYTGSLHDNPTVYFETATEYGHITQYHRQADNIGREVVSDRDMGDGLLYVMRNETINGREVMCEGIADADNPDGPFYPGYHESRNKFMSTQRANVAILSLLAQSIWRFVGIKDNQRRMVQRNRRGSASTAS